MSNGGLDNWKRDYPVKERALLILSKIIDAVDDPEAEAAGIFKVAPLLFWQSIAEAKRLVGEANAT